MKAGIIAAGEGSRLKSEGISLPKPLVPVNGIPLIEHCIRSFAKCGITEIVCIINEYSPEVRRFLEERGFEIPITVMVKTTPSSMHSLFALAPSLKEGQFLLSTVDSIFDDNELSRFLTSSKARSSADGVLAVTKFVDDENPLYVHVDGANRIESFSKSGASPWITGGLYVFSPRIFDEVDAALAQGIERLRNFLGHLLKSGYTLEAFPFSKIVDVDHASDLRVAEEFLRAGNLN